MTNRLKRLARLQALRSQLADAAAAECRHIAAGITEAENTSNRINQDIEASFARTAYAETCWTDQHAMLSVATSTLQHLAVRQEELRVRHETARAAEQQAVQSREQMQRMLDRQSEAEALLESRRLQAQLDDAYAIARIRNGMPTRF